MRFNPSFRCFGRGTSAAVAALGITAATALAAATHPVAAAAALAAVANSMTSCSSGAGCIAGKNSSTGPGVDGTSAKGPGVSGVGYTTGIFGKSTNNFGVWGTTTSGFGVYGFATAKYGVVGEAGGGYAALGAQGNDASTNIFYGVNTANNNSNCVIDPNANLTCSGTVNASKAVRSEHLISNGQHVLTYASESASATLDDVGTARMVGGVAMVAIDAAFASTIDRKSPYHIFLTPMGDTNGLFVSAKTPAGFEVREAHGGHSSVSFDYRIVARPIDANTDRLPVAATAKQLTILHPSP